MYLQAVHRITDRMELNLLFDQKLMCMITSEIGMYDALKKSMGEADAKAFIQCHNENFNTKFNIMKDDLATRGDLQQVKDEVSKLRLDIKDDFIKMRIEFKKNLYTVSLVQMITIIGTILAIIFLRT
jgi:hypothetical protein